MDYNHIFADLQKRNDDRQIKLYGHILTEKEEKLIEQDEREEQILKNEKEQAKQLDFAKGKAISLIPLRFKNNTFGNYDATSKEQKMAVAHLKTGGSAIIYGGNGLGKTHLAFASIRYQIEQGNSAAYILAFNFFNEIKQSFNTHTTDDVMAKYANKNYLVVDEVDKGFGSQTEFVYLYSLINERYNRMMPTVLITNADDSDLVEVIGSSTLSRVAGDGMIIKLSGEDYRKKSK